MIINFNEIERTSMEAFKGGEGTYDVKMFFDGSVRVMDGILKPGCSIGYHTHETNEEFMFITSGTGVANFNGEEEIASPGTCHYCPKGASHSLTNTGSEDLCFLAVVPELGR